MDKTLYPPLYELVLAKTSVDCNVCMLFLAYKLGLRAMDIDPFASSTNLDFIPL